MTTNPTDPAAEEASEVMSRAHLLCHSAYKGEAAAVIQAYGDQREKAAVERGKAIGRQEAFNAIAATLKKADDPLARLMGGLIESAMTNVLDHKEASDGTA